MKRLNDMVCKYEDSVDSIAPMLLRIFGKITNKEELEVADMAALCRNPKHVERVLEYLKFGIIPGKGKE